MIPSCHSQDPQLASSWSKVQTPFQGSLTSCPGFIFCLFSILSRHPPVTQRQAALSELGESCLLHLSLLLSDPHVLSHFCVVCYLIHEEFRRTAVSHSAKCISADHHVLLPSVFNLSEAMIVVICCLLSALPTMRNFDKGRDNV